MCFQICGYSLGGNNWICVCDYGVSRYFWPYGAEHCRIYWVHVDVLFDATLWTKAQNLRASLWWRVDSLKRVESVKRVNQTLAVRIDSALIKLYYYLGDLGENLTKFFSLVSSSVAFTFPHSVCWWNFPFLQPSAFHRKRKWLLTLSLSVCARVPALFVSLFNM